MRYLVSIPIKGTSTFEVEADDAEEAVTAAWEKADEGVDGDVTWEYFEDARIGDVPEASPDRADQFTSATGDKK